MRQLNEILWLFLYAFMYYMIASAMIKFGASIGGALLRSAVVVLAIFGVIKLAGLVFPASVPPPVPSRLVFPLENSGYDGDGSPPPGAVTVEATGRVYLLYRDRALDDAISVAASCKKLKSALFSIDPMNELPGLAPERAYVTRGMRLYATLPLPESALKPGSTLAGLGSVTVYTDDGHYGKTCGWQDNRLLVLPVAQSPTQ